MVTKEEFQKIAQNMFGMTYYDFKSETFFDVDPVTKTPVTQEQKDMFLILQEASKTQIFEDLIKCLPEGTKIKLRTSDSVREGAGAHLGAGCNIEFSTNYHHETTAYNASTFIHELTHAVQEKTEGSERYVLAAKNRLMINCCQEAEARLNAEIAMFQLFYGKYPFIKEEEEKPQKITFFQDLKNRWMKGWNYKESEEIRKTAEKIRLKEEERERYDEMFGRVPREYKRLMEEGLEKTDIVRKVFQSYYSDKAWVEDYQRQFCRSMRTSCHEYEQYEDIKVVSSGYQKRLGLNEEDMAFFLNPENLTGYESSWLGKTALEKRSETYVYDENQTLRQKSIEDNGDEFYAKYDEQGKKTCCLKKIGSQYKAHTYEFMDEQCGESLMYVNGKLIRFAKDGVLLDVLEGKMTKQTFAFKDKEGDSVDYTIEYDEKGLKKLECIKKEKRSTTEIEYIGRLYINYENGRKVKEEIHGNDIKDIEIAFDENGNITDMKDLYYEPWMGEMHIDKEKVMALRERLLRDLPQEVKADDLAGYINESTFYEQTFQKWEKENFEEKKEDPKLSMMDQISKLRGVGDNETANVVQSTKLNVSAMRHKAYTN